jgi:hypothetical protein
VIGKWELLLSVAVPGRPRFGYRFTEKVPRKALLLPGTDIPVDVHADEVRIPWDQIGSVSNFVSGLASLAHAASPASRIVSGPSAQSAEEPGASDPLDDLSRLASLRDAGVLTEAEFAAEKARVLDRI